MTSLRAPIIQLVSHNPESRSTVVLNCFSAGVVNRSLATVTVLHCTSVINIYLRTDTRPLITSATPSTFVQQQVDEQSHALSHEDSGIPVSSSPSTVRNEAIEAGANLSRSRSDELTKRNISPMEDVVLHLKSWYNCYRYCDVSEVQKYVESYCGSVWTDFSNLVGLRLGSSATTANTQNSL